MERKDEIAYIYTLNVFQELNIYFEIYLKASTLFLRGGLIKSSFT